MEKLQFNLAAFLLISAALPIWFVLVAEVSRSPGFGGGAFRFFAAPLVLVGITVAIQRLFRNRVNSWPIAALAAGVIAFGSLSVAVWLSS